MTYLFAVFLWMVWCTLHSALITKSVTDYMERKLGDRYRFYRLCFNIFSLVTFIPLVLFSVSIRGVPIFRWQGLLAIVKYLMLATSLFLFIAGGAHYRMSQFLGIHQIKTGSASQVLSKEGMFQTSGILNVLRHPWYAAGILIVWARDITLSIFLINLVVSAYFVIGTILEERKLLHEFGDTYREYQKNVSMLIPLKWLRGKMVGVD